MILGRRYHDKKRWKMQFLGKKEYIDFQLQARKDKEEYFIQANQQI